MPSEGWGYQPWRNGCACLVGALMYGVKKERARVLPTRFREGRLGRNPMSRYRIVLADDHALLRQGLKKIIGGKSDLTVVGDVGDGISLLSLLKKVRTDMVILDISMPNLRGIEATCEIKKIHPRVKVLILTMHKDMEFLHQAIAAGADGYLLKEAMDTELFSAIGKI